MSWLTVSDVAMWTRPRRIAEDPGPETISTRRAAELGAWDDGACFLFVSDSCALAPTLSLCPVILLQSDRAAVFRATTGQGQRVSRTFSG